MLGSARPDTGIADLPPRCRRHLCRDDRSRRSRRASEDQRATITRELREEDYGARGLAARDPEGITWSFDTYAGAHGVTA
jgi:hypothetical protein